MFDLYANFLTDTRESIVNSYPTMAEANKAIEKARGLAPTAVLEIRKDGVVIRKIKGGREFPIQDPRAFFIVSRG